MEERRFVSERRSLAVFFYVAALALAGQGILRAQAVTLIDAGENWKYFKGTVAPPADWADVGFADDAWLEGPTGIGYGDTDDATVLDDMQNGYLTVFARKSFAIADLASVKRLVLEIDFDDGFIAYLNGAEVARDNAGTAPAPLAFDAPAPGLHEAGTPRSYVISRNFVQQGANVLAIELHNHSLTSSDASLIPVLEANASIAPSGLHCAAVDETVELDWTNTGEYESIQVLRNGEEIAVLPGGDEAFVDESPDTFDNTYRVVGIAAGEEMQSGACTVGCRDGVATCELALVDGKTQGLVSWSDAPTDATSIDIVREGTVIATLDGDATSYVDPDVESMEAEDDTDFSVVFNHDDGRTCTLKCANLSLCPINLTGDVVGGRAHLSWDNVVKNWDHFEISREGVIIDSAVPGDATNWTDTDFALEVGESYAYRLHPVAAAGGELPGQATQCDHTVDVGYAPEIGDYNAPPGGWDYVDDFSGQDPVQYNANTGEPGNLDGNWIRSIDRDLWDGSAPLETGPAPGGPAPGGVDVVNRPAGGPCKTSATVLRILDPGNPANGIGTAFPDDFDPPSNARILLGLDTQVTDRNLLKSGVTFTARLRTSPDAPDYMNPNPASGDGAGFSHSIGHVGIYYRPPTGSAESPVGASFALHSGANGGNLLFSADPEVDVDNVGINNFLALWVTVQENAAQPDTYDVNIYVNGSVKPSAEISGTGITLQDGVSDFGEGVANYLAIGANGTGDDSMIEIDYVGYKVGVFPPTVSRCEAGTEDFRRGDANDDSLVNITDGIFILNFLFLGGDTPACMDAADTNDDGQVNITDGILILNFLFLGGPEPSSPGPDSCGPDASPGDTLVPCISTQC